MQIVCLSTQIHFEIYIIFNGLNMYFGACNFASGLELRTLYYKSVVNQKGILIQPKTYLHVVMITIISAISMYILIIDHCINDVHLAKHCLLV
jgi:hypothetical protein